jgi:hypothetical protein
VSRPTITLPPVANPVDELWHVLLDLAATLRAPWTLVGGQMVLLHALEHQQVPPQISQDGDVIANVRAARDAVGQVVAALESVGFTVDGMSPDGLAHRYIRPAKAQLANARPVKVDVLAPEGLGARANLTTTKPGRTLEVPGGTQALDRTELVVVEHEGRSAAVPRPSLLAALVIKGAASGLPGDQSRHLRDLALLCALVEDPFTMREGLTKKDRSRLRMAGALGSSAHPAWYLVPANVREQGQVAFTVLAFDG